MPGAGSGRGRPDQPELAHPLADLVDDLGRREGGGGVDRDARDSGG